MIINERNAVDRGEVLVAASRLINSGHSFILASFPPDDKPLELVSQMPTSREIEQLVEALLELRRHVRRHEIDSMARELFTKLFGHEPPELDDDS